MRALGCSIGTRGAVRSKKMEGPGQERQSLEMPCDREATYFRRFRLLIQRQDGA